MVQVPTKMNAEQKELLKAFDQAMDGKKEEEPETGHKSHKEKRSPFKKKK